MFLSYSQRSLLPDSFNRASCKFYGEIQIQQPKFCQDNSLMLTVTSLSFSWVPMKFLPSNKLLPVVRFLWQSLAYVTTEFCCKVVLLDNHSISCPMRPNTRKHRLLWVRRSWLHHVSSCMAMKCCDDKEFHCHSCHTTMYISECSDLSSYLRTQVLTSLVRCNHSKS